MLGSLVGREREIATTDEFFGSVHDQPRALVFAGEPGIGKTTLWAKAVERARERGYCVLATRVAEAERELGFAALTDLLEPIIDGVFRDLPEPQRRALSVAMLREEPGERRLDQRSVGAAATATFSRLAQEGPLALAVDDLQWLDSPSGRALEFALRRLHGRGLAFIGSLRLDQDASLPSLALERALPEESVVRLDIGPLSLAGLHKLLKLRYDRAFSRRTLRRVEEISGGNPLFALEVARALPDRVPPHGPLPVPATLGQLVERRISGLPSAVSEALLATAALSAPTVALVAAALGREPSYVRDALETAADVGLIALDGVTARFAHPLFATAVYAAAPSRERRRVHARIAEVVDEAEERARHLGLSAGVPDEAIAQVLERAAEHSRRRGAPETAAALAELARVLTPPQHEEEFHRRTLTAAEYQFHAGELQQAREMVEQVLERVSAGRLRADALRLLGEIRFHENSREDGMRRFEEALALSDDDALRSIIQIHLAFGANVAGDFPRARTHARQALEAAGRLGSDGVLAEALAVTAIADYLNGAGLDEPKVKRALALEDRERTVTVETRPSLIAGYLMLYEGKLEGSVRILSDLRSRILEGGQDSDLSFISSYLGWAECWRGNLGAAKRYCAESVQVTEEIGSDSWRCHALAVAALPGAFAGDRELVRQRVRECQRLTERVGFTIAVFWSSWASAILALSEGVAEDAEAALAPLVVPFEERGLPEPVLGFFLPDAVEALAAVHELKRAERLLSVFEEAATRLQRPWALMMAARCRALVEAARGRLDEASWAAHEAVAIGERVELRLEFARTLLAAGQIERRRRQKRAAREHLERALGIFESAGARIWAERSRAELDRAGFRRAAFDELTETERRVAELAASGLTNREVATRLFMSPKTVESNLARAYRKFGIRSRAELGARLGPKGEHAQT